MPRLITGDFRESLQVGSVTIRMCVIILAEAEIPKAIAEAFRSGNLGIMDYYRMRNIQADTDMRKSISGEGKPEQEQ